MPNFDREQAIHVLDEIESYASTWLEGDVVAAKGKVVPNEDLFARLIAHQTLLARVVRDLVEALDTQRDGS